MTTIRLLTRLTDNPSLPDIAATFARHLGHTVDTANTFPGARLITAASTEDVEACARLYLDPIGVRWEHVSGPWWRAS